MECNKDTPVTFEREVDNVDSDLNDKYNELIINRKTVTYVYTDNARVEYTVKHGIREPVCQSCNHPISNHPYRHPFKYPVKIIKID
jgi:hypothetical protein